MLRTRPAISAAWALPRAAALVARGGSQRDVADGARLEAEERGQLGQDDDRRRHREQAHRLDVDDVADDRLEGEREHARRQRTDGAAGCSARHRPGAGGQVGAHRPRREPGCRRSRRQVLVVPTAMRT